MLKTRLPHSSSVLSDNRQVSLSTYFPKNTYYFYGYPAGHDSGFINKVPPEEEELVSMRPNSCAGPNVNIVSYSPMTSPQIDQTLLDKLDIPVADAQQQVYLPLHITPGVNGSLRNEAIKQALQRLTSDCSLVMAQPYRSQRLESNYQIKPELTAWLNDKQNMKHLVPAGFLPENLGEFSNGADFAGHASKLKLPFVAKASLSSSGDGVYICKTFADVELARTGLAEVTSAIVVEQYVEAIKNFGLHFGIPHDTSKPIDFLGYNEQLTNGEGNFLGGVIRSTQLPHELLSIRHKLKYEILEKVRATGWYGVGGFDVLVDAEGRCYFVDGNFRMTGMSAYHFLVINQQLEPPFISFSGRFKGTRQEFEAAMLPLAGREQASRIIQLIALSEHDDTWRFNAALMFKTQQELDERRAALRAVGIKAAALNACDSFII